MASTPEGAAAVERLPDGLQPPAAARGSGARSILKRATFVASAALVLPLYALYRLNAKFFDRDAAMQDVSQFLSLFPGLAGDFLRSGFYALALRRCSPECRIGFGTIFSTPECEIGRHVYIGAYCVISDSVIEDDTLIGSQVHIVSGKHAHGFTQSDVPMRLQATSRTIIRIGRDSWIGNGAIVMAHVGRGCVIGAGSVVTKPVPDGSIAAGNPARVIRSRTEPLS